MVPFQDVIKRENVPREALLPAEEHGVLPPGGSIPDFRG
jgi:hypothetical protein